MEKRLESQILLMRPDFLSLPPDKKIGRGNSGHRLAFSSHYYHTSKKYKPLFCSAFVSSFTTSPSVEYNSTYERKSLYASLGLVENFIVSRKPYFRTQSFLVLNFLL